VYHALKAEKEERIRNLRSNDQCPKAESLAKRMFWRQKNTQYTAWGNLFVSIIKGVSTWRVQRSDDVLMQPPCVVQERYTP